MDHEKETTKTLRTKRSEDIDYAIAVEGANHIADDSDSDLENDMENVFGDLGRLSEEVIDSKQNPLLWVQNQISHNVNPNFVLRQLVPGIALPENVPDLSVWRLIFEIITEPTPRKRQLHINSLENVINLIQECKNIVVLTGAGVSVSCGIPDFRSHNGIYARLSQDFPDLPDPQAMFDIHFFRCNPKPFFRFAKEIYPGSFTPSLSHYFIQHLEKSGRLLRNYTQNIDTLEQVAGINKVVHCHGSFATVTCMNCKFKCEAIDIESEVFAQKIPYCKQCTPSDGVLNILKPDIVFFGEGLPEEFHITIEKDKQQADLLIVIGSSLKVRPVALIPSFLKPEIPQILINRERLPHMQFDVELYGNCDDVIYQICCQLGDEWCSLTNSFSPSPVNYQKYKSLFDSRNTSCDQTISTDVQDDIIETLNLKDIPVAKQTKESGNAEQSSSSSSGDLLNSKSLKRDFNGAEVISISKRSKMAENKDTIDTNINYFLFYPPNCYIFHGAEFEGDTESEEDSSDEEQDSCNFEEIKENSFCIKEHADCDSTLKGNKNALDHTSTENSTFGKNTELIAHNSIDVLSFIPTMVEMTQSNKEENVSFTSEIESHK